MNKKSLLFFLLLLVPSLSQATIYYIRGTGCSDAAAGTSEATAWCTFEKFDDTAVAGDTLRVSSAGGTITLTTHVILGEADGTISNKITIEPNTGQTPVISASGITGADPPQCAIDFANASDWIMTGPIEIKDNADGCGVTVSSGSNRVELKRLDVHHHGAAVTSAGHGIRISGTAANTLVENNDVHENRNSNDEGSDGIYFGALTGAGTIIRNNRIWRNCDDGIDGWDATGRVTIDGNWIWDQGYTDAGAGCGDGNGIKGGGTGSGDGGHTIQRNFVFNNKLAGIVQNSGDRKFFLYNNTSWRNGTRNYAFPTPPSEGGSTRHDLTNNASYSDGITPSTDNVPGTSTTITTSRMFTTSPQTNITDADFQSLTGFTGQFVTDACTTGPRQADGSLPNCTFARLASGSGMIDSGTPVGTPTLPFNGTDPDIGSFEFSGATDSTPPTVTVTVPSAGASVRGTAVTVTATASDNVGVVGVQFKLDGVDINPEEFNLPYSILWDSTTASNGAHTITAVARDAAGNMTTSAGVAITVDNSVPTVSITAPVDQDAVSGSAVSITATASDNVAVSGVQFKIDGTNLGAEDTTSPYSTTWDTTTVTNGDHTIQAVARDAAGNTTTAQITVTVTNGADVTPPTVSITDPLPAATVSGTAQTVTASASDAVGVVGVQFKVDGVNIGAEDLTSPYSILWDTTTTSNGAHTLTAVARDAAGNSTTSAGISVTVSNTDATPPTVSISAPSPGTVSGTAVTITATASDNVAVAGVTFRVDGTNITSEDTTSPYSISWDSTTVTNGSHTLTALARDTSGNTTLSAGVAVTVDNADAIKPTVSMTAPPDGSTASGTAVTVSATASDNIGVVGVQFQIDGTPLGAEDLTSPYSILWDSTATQDGPHTLSAIARDAANNTETSVSIAVNVNNLTPCALQILPMQKATAAGGFAYQIVQTFGSLADTNALPSRSTLRLFETIGEGAQTELGPAHSAIATIQNTGLGAFLHKSLSDGTKETLYFSTSDRVDPRGLTEAGERQYHFCP